MEIYKSAIERKINASPEIRQRVFEMIERIRQEGDPAVAEYNNRFDGGTREALRVSADEIREAYEQVDKSDVADIRVAAANIEVFAKAQRSTLKELDGFSPAPGITLGHRVIPVESCCCYVPGGNYPLYTSSLMLAVPAKVAGVKRIAACSPTMKGTGKVFPKTLVAMDIAGVDEIYAGGGAQMIAAFSYGTDQITAADMIVGPGNDYVTEAKRQCYGQVGIDFLAGPSEVLIIADSSADPRLIAVDLLAQSEHDLVAKGILITTDKQLADAVVKEVAGLLLCLETAERARGSWEQYGEIILVDSLAEAVQITNGISPEHLELHTADNDGLIPGLTSYGSLFIGQYTAEVFGDYASGTNHTLPTLRVARYTGGVWVGTFLKTCTHQSMTREGMLALAPLVSALAKGEGLAAHALAADLRSEIFK